MRAGVAGDIEGACTGMPRLSLDHITAVDTDPVGLVKAAAGAGCAGICLFLQSMEVLPHMPRYDLVGDKAARTDCAAAMKDLSVNLDLAYPFTMAGRTEVSQFAAALECAAELGAPLANLLVYDREPGRRLDRFGAFCDLARTFGLGTAVEFYPVSQVRSLGEALELVEAIDRPGEVGVNVDILHLMRSGGSIADLVAAPAYQILYGQICDGPERVAPERLGEEASSARLLAGEGVFEIAAFARALPGDCPVRVEIPRDAALVAGVGPTARASRAVDSVRQILAAA